MHQPIDPTDSPRWGLGKPAEADAFRSITDGLWSERDAAIIEAIVGDMDRYSESKHEVPERPELEDLAESFGLSGKPPCFMTYGNMGSTAYIDPDGDIMSTSVVDIEGFYYLVVMVNGQAVLISVSDFNAMAFRMGAMISGELAHERECDWDYVRETGQEDE